MKTRALVLLTMPLLLLVRVAAAQPAATPYESVDPFIGTGGEGHTYPGATVPFGMVQLSPDTDVRHFRQSFPWAAGYRYGDATILGFSHTHFSGTGHSDLGDVLLMPTVGPLQLEPGSAEEPDAAIAPASRMRRKARGPATTRSCSPIRASRWSSRRATASGCTATRSPRATRRT